MNVTEHARDRVRKRAGIPKKAVDRMAEKALLEGRKHGEFSGQFKRYLDHVYFTNRGIDNMRVYSEHLFLFAGETLVTAWRLHNKFLKALR